MFFSLFLKTVLVRQAITHGIIIIKPTIVVKILMKMLATKILKILMTFTMLLTVPTMNRNVETVQ